MNERIVLIVAVVIVLAVSGLIILVAVLDNIRWLRRQRKIIRLLKEARDTWDLAKQVSVLDDAEENTKELIRKAHSLECEALRLQKLQR